MVERRQVSRREPIEVEVRGRVFVAEPLPWQVVGDLGNEIVRQNAEAANEAIRLYVQDDIPQLDLKLAQKISDWMALLKIAFPQNSKEDFLDLDIDEVSELILASVDVNHLQHLRHLVDPNFQTPTNLGGTSTSEGMMTDPGLKIESMLSSASSGLPGKELSSSPVESSSSS
jgi:hypothetical protein